MNSIDIAVVLGLSFFAYKGYKNGLVHELLTLAALGAGLLAGHRWTPKLVPRIAEAIPGPAFLDTGVAFLILFTLVLMTGRYIATIVRRVWVQANSSPANRMAGMSFGIFKGALVLGCTILALRSFAPEAQAAEDAQGGMAGRVAQINGKVDQSYIAARLADLTGGFFSALMESVGERVRELTTDESPEGP